ncbi:hypothetical protein ABZ345_16150 [Lentzea sp. NPDC005914]|uniref:hypothetical protein n=1 Tax=Lentzea sp. NPDC005914 TaxID=3154572 RepID=UPI0033CEB330
MKGDERELLRARSAAIFGNRYVAEVVLAVAELAPRTEDQVTVRMLARRTGLTDSLVRPVIKRLVQADVLRPLPQQRPRGASYHQIHFGQGVWEALMRTCTLLRQSS